MAAKNISVEGLFQFLNIKTELNVIETSGLDENTPLLSTYVLKKSRG